MRRFTQIFILTAIFLTCCATSYAGKNEWIYTGALARDILKNYYAAVPGRPRETKPIGGFEIFSKSRTLSEKYGAGFFEQVETAAGPLTNYSYGEVDHRLYLRGKELARAEHLRIMQVYPEKRGRPSLALISMYSGGYDPLHKWEKPYVLDVGVTPPFISSEFIPVMPQPQKPRDRNDLLRSRIDIKRLDANTFIISGTSFRDGDIGGRPKIISYKYSRKTRKLTRI